MEATGKTSSLSRDLRNLLKDIDGKVSVSELLDLGRMAEPKLLEALDSLGNRRLRELLEGLGRLVGQDGVRVMYGPRGD